MTDHHKATRATPTAYPSELTPLGDQLLIPGCERRAPPGAKPATLDLWDAAGKVVAE